MTRVILKLGIITCVIQLWPNGVLGSRDPPQALCSVSESRSFACRCRVNASVVSTWDVSAVVAWLSTELGLPPVAEAATEADVDGESLPASSSLSTRTDG